MFPRCAGGGAADSLPCRERRQTDLSLANADAKGQPARLNRSGRDHENSKWRAEIAAPHAATKDELAKLVAPAPDVANKLGDGPPKRVIVVPGRLVNFVV